MNALTASVEKVRNDLERIIERLDEVEDRYDFKRSEYRYDTYTRQSARTLGGLLRGIVFVIRDGHYDEARQALDDIAERWNVREDWRTAAFASNTARRMEKLIGLGA